MFCVTLEHRLGVEPEVVFSAASYENLTTRRFKIATSLAICVYFACTPLHAHSTSKAFSAVQRNRQCSKPTVLDLTTQTLYCLWQHAKYRTTSAPGTRSKRHPQADVRKTEKPRVRPTRHQALTCHLGRSPSQLCSAVPL